MAAITRSEIEALFAEGVLYCQLDNPGYSQFVGSHVRTGDGHGGQNAFAQMVATDRAAVEGIERPEGAAIGMHVCRGNQKSLWLAEGDYGPIAEQLFAEMPVDRFLLEFDDERAGGFEPLRYIPAGKVVVLGLLSSKHSELESIEDLQAKIDAAAEIIPIDDLAVSPQCGFASVADGGNAITVDDERKKLRRVADTAIATWGFEA
jgi:5-methyltetrahydropteroyltriglutamate--homocysteine methyltransferase